MPVAASVTLGWCLQKGGCKKLREQKELGVPGDYLVMRLLSRKLGEPLRRGMEGLRAYDREREDTDLEQDLQRRKPAQGSRSCPP